MSEGAMSHGVSKLKELLFDTEAERLDGLSRRLDALSAQTQDTRRALSERQAYEEGARAELARRIDAVFERAGSDERLTRSVADVLDNAFQRAETERHDALANAVAPVVVKTIKTEIFNSRDDLVEVLYPMTGQMVKAYVASAMKDLVNQVNRRLEQNPLMLRIKSLTTGRSMAELAIAESQRLEVDELLLIRRGTGELVARWPQRSDSNHDHVMSGVLTAINSFASEALDSNEAVLRQIDLGASQVYLRASPAYLLAAKCSGTAHAAIEQTIDEEFLETVKSLHGDHDAGASAKAGLEALGPRLSKRISAQHEEAGTAALSISPVKLLALLIGVPLAAWFAWSTYVTYETNRVRQAAKDIIETSPEIKGYPTTITVTPRGRALIVTGLAPSMAAQQAVTERLTSALPRTTIDNQIAVVPQGARDASPEIAALRNELKGLNADIPRRTSLSALFRARLGLSQSLVHLSRLDGMAGMATDGAGKRLKLAGQTIAPVKQAEDAVTKARDILDKGLPDANALAALAATLNLRAVELETAIDRLAQETDIETLAGGAPARTKPRPDTAAATYVESAEHLAELAQRLRLITVALVQAEITRLSIPKPVAPQPAPVIPQPTAFERLQAFVKSNAVFFADSTDYRDAAVSDPQLDQLANLMRETGALVRVIGYTDDRGSSSRNSSLSQQRADKVRDALVMRGVPAENLVSIGRHMQIDISPNTGTNSPNRRVEFEVGFKGEGAR